MTVSKGKLTRPLLRKGAGISQNEGFTLVEMTAVLAILGLLAAIAVPAVVDSVQEARGHATEAGKAQLEALLNQFYLEEEAYPESLEELVSGGYTMELPHTGKGEEYIYKRTSSDTYSLELPD